MAAWIKIQIGMELGLGPGDFIVLDGDPATPSPKKGGAPQIFGPCLLWPNGWMDQDGTWHGNKTRRLCVRWRPSPWTKSGRSPHPQFSAHFYCGQTAGCIKMPLLTYKCSATDLFLDGFKAVNSKLLWDWILHIRLEKNNLLKYITLQSTTPILLAASASSLMNPYFLQTKFHLSPNPANIISVIFVVSAVTSIPLPPVLLLPPSFTPNLITVILRTTTSLSSLK